MEVIPTRRETCVVLTDSLSVIRWQFSMTWSLADIHLSRLTDAQCRWLPDESSWTVHLQDDGRWLADWTEPEPASPAPPSIAWLTWHMTWWWAGALRAVRGESRIAPTSAVWAGDAEVAAREIRDLAKQWIDLLDHLGRGAGRTDLAEAFAHRAARQLFLPVRCCRGGHPPLR